MCNLSQISQILLFVLYLINKISQLLNFVFCQLFVAKSIDINHSAV